MKTLKTPLEKSISTKKKEPDLEELGRIQQYLIDHNYEFKITRDTEFGIEIYCSGNVGV